MCKCDSNIRAPYCGKGDCQPQEVVEILKTTFDNTENDVSAAINTRSVGMFWPSVKKTAFGVAKEWIDQNLHSVGMYAGHDGEVYPKYTIKTHFPKSTGRKDSE